MAVREKNTFILIIFILCGLVIGGLIGELTKNVSWLNFLSYGQSFGLTNPVTLDLGVMQLTLGLMFKITIAGILGMILSILLYKKF